MHLVKNLSRKVVVIHFIVSCTEKTFILFYSLLTVVICDDKYIIYLYVNLRLV